MMTYNGNGVYRFCTTELDEGITALYEEKGIGRIVYLTHAEIGSIHRACKHASMSFKANQNLELFVVLMPRHMQVCVFSSFLSHVLFYTIL